jgi:hypothetical protein
MPGSAAALSSFPVHAFLSQPPPTPDDRLEPIVATRSDGMGFYELPLPPGRYWLCTTSRRCAEIDTTANAILRKDYDSGPGAGW